LLAGPGINPSEAGQVWFQLSERLNRPVTKIDPANLNRVDWTRYTTLVLVGGQYGGTPLALV